MSAHPTNPDDRAAWQRGYFQAAADILAKMTDVEYPRASAAWRAGYAERLRLEDNPQWKSEMARLGGLE